MNLNDGLISYWTMDETSGVRADSAGRFDLQPANNPASVPGVLGQAAIFDGTSTQGLYALNFPYLTTFTITGWFNLSDISPGSEFYTGIFMSVDPKGSNISTSWNWNFYFFILSLGNGNGQVQFCADNYAQDYADVNTHIFDGERHFFAASIDSVNNLVSLQVDDRPNSTVVLQQPLNSVSDPGTLVIGYDPIYNDGFRGALDEIGIWSRILTPEEITQLRNKVCPTGIIRPTGIMTSILAKKRFILHTSNSDKMILQNYAAVAEMAKSLLTTGQVGSKDKAKKLLAAQVNQQYFKAESGSVHNKRVVNFR